MWFVVHTLDVVDSLAISIGMGQNGMRSKKGLCFYGENPFKAGFE